MLGIANDKVNIVDNRPSLFAFDNITINDNLDLHVDGQAFIYYTNYDNAEDVTYKVYLIKDKLTKQKKA